MILAVNHGPPSVTSSSCSSNGGDGAPSVAIIGCGPGGMSFLHAVATRRKQMMESGDLEGIQTLPVVTCFERNAGPGGVWRSAKDNKGSTNMYEGLWINGPKEALEYYDYTFDDHFGCTMPAFIPRAQVLDYMLKRMTQHEDIFKHVKFNTTVNSVSYDQQEEDFKIQTTDSSGVTKNQVFDKCIYSAGLNALPRFNDQIKAMLGEQKFKGQVVHSSEMNKLGTSVKGKRIVMIGDSFSTEDLALQCIKLGASKIYITSRRNLGISSYVGAWPDDKVEFLWYKLPYALQGENTLLCRSDEKDEDIDTISDVSIVIFCTGYNANLTMLAPDLHPFDLNVPCPKFKVSSDWKMRENCLTDAVGEVQPQTEIDQTNDFVWHRLYKRMLIENTNMMFLFEATDYPLTDIDIGAWMCLTHILGEIKALSPKEMRKRNQDTVLEVMQSSNRCSVDKNYREALSQLPKSHWYHNILSEEYTILLKSYSDFAVKFLASEQNDCGYPVQYGNGQSLNEMGQQLSLLNVYDTQTRYKLNADDPDSKWRTFRDADPTEFKSIFTGTVASSLKEKWLDLDDEGNLHPQKSK